MNHIFMETCNILVDLESGMIARMIFIEKKSDKYDVKF